MAAMRINEIWKSGRKALVVLAASALALTGCGSSEGSASTSPSADSSASAGAMGQQDGMDSKSLGSSLNVYATTGYLADAVANIAPGAQVTTMVGPGGDPHTYQPSTQDIEKMSSADVVLWTGLHLEAQMIDQLRGLGEKQLEVGAKLDPSKLLPWPETDHEGNPLNDPHIWNDPDIWKDVVSLVAQKLGEADQANAEAYQKNAEEYKGKIDQAVSNAKAELDKIPEESRVLITGHDAFNYFGRTFGYEIKATDFVSSEAQLSAAELSELADLIANKKVPVIFQDNLANPQAITSLKEAVQSRGWQVEVSDEVLFADTLGDTEGVDNYIGALEYNAKTVAAGLGKK